MKKLVLLFLILPVMVVAQEKYKSIKGFTFLGYITAPEGYALMPGQISKDGKLFYLPITDTSGKGFINEIDVTGKGKWKSGRMIPVEDIEGKDFAGQASFSEDGTIMTYTTTFENSWTNNDICIAKYDARSNRFIKARGLGELNDNENADAYSWLSPNGLRIYYMFDSKIMYSVRKNTDVAFEYPKELVLGGEQLSFRSCWLNNDETIIYLVDSENILYKATRKTIQEKFSKPDKITSDFAEMGFISGISIRPSDKLFFVYSSISEGDNVDEISVIFIYKMKK